MGYVEIPRLDLFSVGEIQYEYSTTGPDYLYRYRFDNSSPTVISLNHVSPLLAEPPIMSSSGEPEGWTTTMNGWTVATATPGRGPESLYWCLSSYRPGLIPLYFRIDQMKLALTKTLDNINRGRPDDEDIPPSVPWPVRKRNDHDRYLDHQDEQFVNWAMRWHNSVCRPAIGPLFPPNISKEAIMQQVREWIELWGCEFLKPFLDGAPLSSLKPESTLGKDAVICLKHVLDTLQQGN